MYEAILKAAEIISNNKGAVALTGAGVSVPSGIPDFRSPGGVWDKYDMGEYGSIDNFIENPAKVWKLFDEFDALIGSALPNPAHLALAKLEERGFLNGIITQNIDGLHQQAGSKNVIEFHGSCTKLQCINCGWRGKRKEKERDDKTKVPECPQCGKAVKPAVVLFGEQVPAAAINDAFSITERAKVFLTIGTSAMTTPASAYIDLAFRKKIPIIEINKQKTQITNSMAEISIIGDAAETLPALVEEILK